MEMSGYLIYCFSIGKYKKYSWLNTDFFSAT